jgi:NDP-sugar pyrophosphorylase family protein
MKYAIIAAGEGVRLQKEGIKTPKPLVKVHGEHLIDRLIRIFMMNGASGIISICNDHSTLVSKHLRDIQENGLGGQKVPLEFIIKTTPTPLHSCLEVSKYLGDEPFCVATTDTVFREDMFHDYISAFRHAILSDDGIDGMMGVTDFVDDEKPLFVDVDSDMTIKGFYDEKRKCKYISGGLYGLTHRTIATLSSCADSGCVRLRDFQRALVAEGRQLKAFPMGRIIDVDHAMDIMMAEELLR